jgi:hypothetical protein
MLLAPPLEMTPCAFAISDTEKSQTPGAMKARRRGVNGVCELTELDGAARVADEPPAFGGIFERAGGIRRRGGPRLCARNEFDDLGT